MDGVAASTDFAKVVHPGLRPEFCRFAEWIFGPQGVGSLHLVVFGDFAYGGRKQQNNLVLCRNTADGGNSNFRIIDHEYGHEAEILNEYRDVLGVCPMEPLLEVG